MIRRWLKEQSGVAALEFAMVAPVLIGLMLGALGLGVAIWYKNILQSAALDSARCIALSSPVCMTPKDDCASGPAVCYAVATGRSRGLGSLKPEHVSVDSLATMGSKTFTAVKIDYPYGLLGYQFTLSVAARYPNRP